MCFTNLYYGNRNLFYRTYHRFRNNNNNKWVVAHWYFTTSWNSCHNIYTQNPYQSWLASQKRTTLVLWRVERKMSRYSNMLDWRNIMNELSPFITHTVSFGNCLFKETLLVHVICITDLTHIINGVRNRNILYILVICDKTPRTVKDEDLISMW